MMESSVDFWHIHDKNLAAEFGIEIKACVLQLDCRARRTHRLEDIVCWVGEDAYIMDLQTSGTSN